MSSPSGEIYGQEFDSPHEALAIVLAAMCAENTECPLTVCMDSESERPPLCPLKGVWCNEVTIDDWLGLMESNKE